MARNGFDRVNLRGVPKSLAGVPVDRMTLGRIKLRVAGVLPPRPLERPLSDLLAAAYMAGIIDAAKQGGLLDDGGEAVHSQPSDQAPAEPSSSADKTNA